MKILVLNCGSSSIKYQLIHMDANSQADVLAKGLIERIGLSEATLTHQAGEGDKIKSVHQIPEHQEGINLILKALVSPDHGVIKDINEISAVGHRVAHGGEKFNQSVRIDQAVEDNIRECIELAPLHNPANLKGITCIKNLLPQVPQVAVFDTSFHQTMPDYSYMYAIPYKYYEQYRIRRYGFHGTSHKFVAQKACEMTGLDFNTAKIVSCHLGNGASIAAIDGGKSIDTSMGFTPVEGLMMGTRCGDLDQGVSMYIQEKENLSISQLNDVLNKKSGLQGVSDMSSDMRDLEAAAKQGDAKAILALKMFSYRVKKYVGAYAAAMGGVDIILFTGGIGENGCAVRQTVCEGLEFMGAKLDIKLNDGLRGKDTIISTTDSRVKILLVTTDEELVIATDTFNLAK